MAILYRIHSLCIYTGKKDICQYLMPNKRGAAMTNPQCEMWLKISWYEMLYMTCLILPGPHDSQISQCEMLESLSRSFLIFPGPHDSQTPNVRCYVYFKGLFSNSRSTWTTISKCEMCRTNTMWDVRHNLKLVWFYLAHMTHKPTIWNVRYTIKHNVRCKLWYEILFNNSWPTWLTNSMWDVIHKLIMWDVRNIIKTCLVFTGPHDSYTHNVRC